MDLLDFWDYLFLCLLAMALLVRWLPRPTSAKSVERRVREYRLHHTNPRRYRRTRHHRTPRLRDQILRFCGGATFLAYPHLRERTLGWAGDFFRNPGSKVGSSR